MKLRKSSAIFFVLAQFVYLSTAQAQYSFTDLGAPLSGYANSTAAGVNNKGEVVGICYNDILLSQAFLWTNGVFSALSLPSHNVTRAGRINDNGDIIGVATITALQDGYYVNAGSTLVHWNRNFPNTQFNPVAWPAGHYKNSFDYAYPSGINQNNQAAGSTILNQSWGDFWSNGNQIVYAGDLDQQVPALWDNGVMTILAPADLQPWDLFYGRAHDINDNGTIVGTMSRYSFIDSSRNASFTFISQSGGPAEPLPGPFFYPFRINNAGDILCLSPEPDYLPSIYRNGTFIPLGTLDSGGGRLNPRSMNNQAQVVGDALNTVTGLYTAFLWQLDPVTGQGTIVDLNEAAAPEGWHLNAGNQITDSGIIVGSGTFEGQERAFMLTPAVIAVDANRDGEITFDGKDGTSPDKPFRFWLNDDRDFPVNLGVTSGFLVVPESESTEHDSDNQIIQTTRDLEDFAQLAFIANESTKQKIDQGYKLAIETTGDLRIKLYKAAKAGTDYLFDGTGVVPGRQVGGTYANGGVLKNFGETVDMNDLGPYIKPAEYGSTPVPFLFEGDTAGTGAIRLVLKAPGGQTETLGEAHIKLMPIKEMYERARAIPEDGFPFPYAQGFVLPQVGFALQTPSVQDSPPPDEEKQCIIFVHGWNLTLWECENWSEIFFKRLWWQGYRGRFAAFRWPPYGANLASITRNDFNSSEHRAFKYATGLKAYADDLQGRLSGYTMDVVAHSQGNIVTSEALKQGMSVNNYVLMQAAVSAGCYDENSGLNLPRFMRAERGQPTPDLAADLGYRGYFKNVNGNLINFFNPVDFALVEGTIPEGGNGRQANWQSNNVANKPFDPPGRGRYSYGGRPRRPRFEVPARPDRIVTDPHESMAMVARSRTRAVGAEAQARGNLDDFVDLSQSFGPGNPGFTDARLDHDAQFYHDIQHVHLFYEVLKDRLFP